MINGLMLPNGKPAQISRSINEKMRTLDKEGPGVYIERVNGTDWDVRESMMYLFNQTATDETFKELAKTLKPTEVYELLNTGATRVEFPELKADGSLDSKEAYLTVDVADDTVSKSLFELTSTSGALSSMYSVIIENETVRNEVVSTATLLSLSCINNKYNDVVCITNFHTSLVYYWLSKHVNFNSLGQSLNHIGFTKKSKLLQVEPGVSFEEFLLNFFSKKEQIAIMKYMADFYKYNHVYSMMEHCEELTKLALAKVQTSGSQKSTHELMLSSLKNPKTTPVDIWNFLDNRRINMYAAVSTVINPVLVVLHTPFNWKPVLSYECITLIKKGKIDTARYKQIRLLARYIAITNKFGEVERAYLVLVNSQKNVKETLERNKRDNAELQKQQENIQKKYTELRSKLKESDKKAKRALRELEHERSKNVKKNNGEHEVPIEDFNRLKQENEQLKHRVTSANESVLSLERKVAQKDKEISKINTKLQDESKKYNELLAKYNRSEEMASQMDVAREFNGIPMECFINTIKDTRIALIGGDMMHTRIKEYGLDNIRLYKAGHRGICWEELSDIDLIVIATAYIDHATVGGVVKLARAHSVPMLNFNNKNVDILIYSLFKELHK